MHKALQWEKKIEALLFQITDETLTLKRVQLAFKTEVYKSQIRQRDKKKYEG